MIQYNGTIVQDIECEKYHIDGEKACSYVLGIGENGTFRNVMQVLTVVGERSYVISYSTSPENFDKDLPILKTMLQSFKQTESLAATAS